MMPAPKAESVRAKGGFLTTEDTPHTATVKMPISGVYEYLSARACEPILTIPITGSREIKYQSHQGIKEGQFHRPHGEQQVVHIGNACADDPHVKRGASHRAGVFLRKKGDPAHDNRQS